MPKAMLALVLRQTNLYLVSVEVMANVCASPAP
jgi:hypothetical protein